jgi:hypothetical protein
MKEGYIIRNQEKAHFITAVNRVEVSSKSGDFSELETHLILYLTYKTITLWI